MFKIIKNIICKYKKHKLYHDYDSAKTLCVHCIRCKRSWYLGSDNRAWEFGVSKDKWSISQIEKYIKCLK